jgi:hypothetical protein
VQLIEGKDQCAGGVGKGGETYLDMRSGGQQGPEPAESCKPY